MHVKFTYFKDSGSYYSEGEIDIPVEFFHEAVEEIRRMLINGTRPGLIDGHSFHTHAEIFTEHGPLPYLFVRNSNALP